MARRSLRRWLWRAALCALTLAAFAFLLPDAVRAEALYRDASQDARAYRRSVSALNAGELSPGGRQIWSNSVETDEDVARRTVLFRTDGHKPACAEVSANTEGLECLLLGPDGQGVMRLSTAAEARRAVQWLLGQPWIIYAETDGMIGAADFESWAVPMMRLDGYLSFAAGWGTGDAVVAVLDSGTYPHEMYRDRLLTGGYDYVDDDEDPFNDEYGHGTNVTGVIADGTRGAEVYLYPIRILNASGDGKVSNAIAAISEACDAGVDVVNLSLAAKASSAALEDAVTMAAARGVAVVVAAGNFGCDTAQVTPACVTTEGVIVVGAAERSGDDDVRAVYSCYGESVDVYAYGTEIRCCDIDDGYTVTSGTSLAAPHVSAACALMKLLHPSIQPAEIEARLKAAKGASEGLALKLGALIPSDEGFRLTAVCLAQGETLRLPVRALPETADEAITWTAEGGAIRVSGEGVVEALSPGGAALTASCRGFDDITVPVTVLEDGGGTLILPAGLTGISEEAFAGTHAGRVIIPEGVQSVAAGAFSNCGSLRIVEIAGAHTVLSPDAFGEGDAPLILCPRGSAALADAEERGWPYVAAGDR